MPLSAGEKLGPYEIVAPIGAGGMGEVYKATDTRLGRDVAVKVSAKQFSERFEREARAIAALNHPNICTLFDVGPNYLVMELVEGPTLAERIKEGAIPLEEALKIAQQIGAALECAHELPIIHRDLKPANIKIKPDGVVKVLDFGLAKMGSDAPADSDATITLGATQAGAILGTPAYMAPEQARGKPLTKSADIWAFGVVFHEMLTGQRTFVGDDITMTLASVVMKDPDFAPIPQKVRRLLKKCLEKDPKKRLHDIADVWDYLEDENAGQAVVQPADPSTRLWQVVAAVSLVALLGLAAWAFYPRPATPTTGAIRFTLPPPEGATITATNTGAPQIALSPDGRYLAFIADETGKERTLWVRALGSLSAQKLDKTDGAGFPFWSPDSQHIAFFADSKLKRIPVSGGSPVNIAEAGVGDGGTWFQEGNGEGVIVFAPATASPLLRVPASGGRPTPFTKLAEGETAHIFPQFLPDGKRVLYFARGGSKPGIYVQALGAEERTFVVQTPGRAVFSPPNFLLFLSDTTLMAQRLDLASLKLQGEPVSVADEVRNGGNNGRNSFSVSSNGMLAYRQGGGGGQLQLRWYSRDGKSTGVALPMGPNGPFELSPDDKRVVVRRGDGNEVDLWLLELTTGVFSRLTSSPGSELDPVWAPDSRRIAFATQGRETAEIRESVIGSGKETTIFANGKTNYLEGWTHDGKQLLIRDGNKLFTIPAPEEGSGKVAERKPQLVLDVRFVTDEVQVSPDGKWVAYMSRESGRPEVNVAAFPSFTNRRQISTGGAAEPRWRADGKELFFRAQGGVVLAVDVKAGATLETGPIRTLFQGSPVTSTTTTMYAVSSDGQRFLMAEPQGINTNTVEQLYVVANWPALVK